MSLNQKVTGLIMLVGVLSVLSISNLYAESWTVEQYTQKFQEAYHMEKMTLYTFACRGYMDVLDHFFMLQEKKSNATVVEQILPIIISTAYRLGIANGKNIQFDYQKLGGQLTYFEKVNTAIEKVIYRIQTTNIQNTVQIQRKDYACLFFSRAYNRIAWANRVLSSIIWKNYIVMPMTDIISMLSYAEHDLKRLLEFEQQPLLIQRTDFSKVSGKPKHDFDALYGRYKTSYSNMFDSLETESIQFQVYRYAYDETDRTVLSAIIAKRSFFQAFQVIYFLESPYVKTILNKASSLYSLSEITDMNNREIYTIFNQITKKIGLSK